MVTTLSHRCTPELSHFFLIVHFDDLSHFFLNCTLADARNNAKQCGFKHVLFQSYFVFKKRFFWHEPSTMHRLGPTALLVAVVLGLGGASLAAAFSVAPSAALAAGRPRVLCAPATHASARTAHLVAAHH